MEREEDETAGFFGVAYGFDRLGNFEAAGHEYEDVAFRTRQDEIAESFGCLVPYGAFVDVSGGGGISDVDGVSATLRFNDAARLEVIFEASGVERGGHDENLEVGALLFLQIESAGEGDVAVEVAFVEFVEDERGNAGEFWVLHDLAEENAFGDETDASLRTGHVFKADLVANFTAEFRIAFGGNASCEQASGEPTGLKDYDLAVAEQSVVKEHLGNLGGLAGASWGGDDDSAVSADTGEQFGFDLVNGQTIHCGKCMEGRGEFKVERVWGRKLRQFLVPQATGKVKRNDLRKRHLWCI